ncbi:ras-related protein Rab-7a-like isoform X3 [Stegostoma tigrinum]|uniref:ras-related protein Rab-7a-like isoform X3 n=1 Tax=Stegostoma tigrinum TaxID=3053191 RepID=UPI002870A24B|nr:ras-related protein Rab-7a-like isoform X3 [Stegostoma tigrinum]
MSFSPGNSDAMSRRYSNAILFLRQLRKFAVSIRSCQTRRAFPATARFVAGFSDISSWLVLGGLRVFGFPQGQWSPKLEGHRLKNPAVSPLDIAESMTKPVHLKVVLLGDSGVGKSSLMNQYVNKHYTNQYKATIGADFLNRNITVDGKNVCLQLWDTAGTERFHSLGSILYRAADCCVLVFDVTSEASFKALDSWRKEFLLQADPSDPDNFPFLVIGNKADLSSSREVVSKQAEKWCGAHRLKYIETSAKEARNVEAAFQDGVRLALKRLRSEDQIADQFDHVQLTPEEDRQRNSCACG